MTSESRYSPDLNLHIRENVTLIQGAVIGFFTISGFLFKVPNSIGEGIIKSAKRLLIPYFIFSICYVIIMYFLGKGELGAGFVKTLLFKGGSMQLYYLPYLFLVSTLTILFFRLISSQYSKLFYTIILTIILICVFFIKTESVTGSDYKLLFYYYIAYSMGVLLKKFINDKTPYIILPSITLILGLYFNLNIIYILINVVLLVVFYYLSIFTKILNRSFPGSGGIYLLHTPILNFAISTLLMKFGFLEYTNLYLSLLLTYIVCLLITLTFIRYFPRWRFLFLE